MAKTSVLPGLVLAGLSSAALAGTAVTGIHTGAHAASHPSIAGPAVRAGGNARPAVMTHGAAPATRANAAPPGTTLTHAMVAGEHANVVQMPVKHPLTDADRRKLKEHGFAPVMQNGETYFCRHVHRTEDDGWVKDCFKPVR